MSPRLRSLRRLKMAALLALLLLPGVLATAQQGGQPAAPPATPPAAGGQEAPPPDLGNLDEILEGEEEVLSGAASSSRQPGSLSLEDRRAIVDILRATRPGLPASTGCGRPAPAPRS